MYEHWVRETVTLLIYENPDTDTLAASYEKVLMKDTLPEL